MPGDRDYVTQQKLDLEIQKLLKRIRAGGTGGSAANIIISDDPPTAEDGEDGYIWLEY